MPTARTTTERRFTGLHMLLLLGAFFGVIIGVNVVMAVSATSTWTGLVVQNSYVASQEFNEKQVAWREQHALGWTPAVSYQAGVTRFTLIDGDGRAVQLDDLTIQLNRPIGARDDRTLPLTPAADGSYVAETELQPGVWEAVVTAAPSEHGPFEYHTRFRITDPQ